MNAIACLDAQDALGYQGELVYRIPEDLRNFYELTTQGKNNVIIMGRKTHESMGCTVLKKRINIVLSRDPEFVSNDPNLIVARSKEEAISYTKGADNIFIIGGSAIYDLFEPEIETFYVSRVMAIRPADTFYMLPLDFQMVHESDPQFYGDLSFTYQIYKKHLEDSFV